MLRRGADRAGRTAMFLLRVCVAWGGFGPARAAGPCLSRSMYNRGERDLGRPEKSACAYLLRGAFGRPRQCIPGSRGRVRSSLMARSARDPPRPCLVCGLRE